MHIVQKCILLYRLYKFYCSRRAIVEVQYDRAHNNDDSINQDGMFCMYRIEISSEEHKKNQNKPIAVVFGLLPILCITHFAVN